MADGTRLTCIEEISHSNKEESLALQRGQVETHYKHIETQNHLGVVETCLGIVEGFLKSIESMLKEALKMKSTVHKHATSSVSNGENYPKHSHPISILITSGKEV